VEKSHVQNPPAALLIKMPDRMAALEK